MADSKAKIYLYNSSLSALLDEYMGKPYEANSKNEDKNNAGKQA